MSQPEKEIIDIITNECKFTPFGVLTLELIVKDGKVVRVEASTTKRCYKVNEAT